MASNQVLNAGPELFGENDVTKDYMYENLWDLCAGLCDLPKVEELVYYFPQGHLEHIEASTNQELVHIKPFCDTPSKFRCRVISIKLKAERVSDDVYAEITLMPDTTQVIPPVPNDNRQRPKFPSFIKVLTSSDLSKHGGFPIPQRLATDCLPPLDISQPIATQELVAKDIHNNVWRFKHIFRGVHRKHIFTTGWNAFVTSKKLVVGDSVVFIRGENMELRIGIKRLKNKQCNKALHVLPMQTMHNGVIATPLEAFRNKCRFTVAYKPRSSQFVVSYDKFVNAMNNKFSVGSKFKMQFEDERFIEKSYFGTIIGANDFSPHWKNSEWRSLHVQWDDHASFQRPNKVSPWEIEHFPSSSCILELPVHRNKRSRQVNEFGSTSSNPWTPMLVNQGQETGQLSVSQLNYQDTIRDCKTLSCWPVSPSLHTESKQNNNEDQIVTPMKEEITTDATTSFKLFGVDLTIPSKIQDPIRLVDLYQKSKICSLSQERKLDHIKTLKSPKEIRSSQINSTKTRTKVHMQGVAKDEVVDLTVLGGYNELKEELEKLFDLKDKLITRNQWEVVFTDNEGDMMLVGDDPWLEFFSMVKEIFIYSKEEIKKMKPANKFPQI